MKFKVTLATVAEAIVEVDAADEESAIESAFDVAREVSRGYHAGHNWTVSYNDEWQYAEPIVKPVR